MTIPHAQLVADRDRRFADWGETVTFREVGRSFDPQTQQVSESHTDTAVTAVVADEPWKPVPDAAGQYLSGEIGFVIKAEDLPVTEPSAAHRVVYDNVEYDVLAFHRSAQKLVYILDCRKTR